jgi:hypothetical protein
MLWLAIWMTVILKIPALYLAYVLWWAVKDPPEAETGSAGDGLYGGGMEPPRVRGPRTPVAGRRPGPHGSHRSRRAAERRPARRVGSAR